MDEAYQKRNLVKAIREAMPGAIVTRHEDTFTAGIPDLSVSWAGTTSWTEVKYERNGRKAVPTALQSLALENLRRVDVPAFLVTYRERKGVKSVEVARGDLTWSWDGFDHARVADDLRSAHLARRSDLEKVRAFNEKFGMPLPAAPTADWETADRRADHLAEEFAELEDGINRKDMAAVADALVDIVYVALGMALNLGLPWQRIFDAVQAANMTKERVEDGTKKFGIRKPHGWRAPDIRGILVQSGYQKEETK